MRTQKERLEEVYAFADICFWILRENLEAELQLTWDYVPWGRVANRVGCAAVTLQRLYARQTRFVRFDTLQKLADASGMAMLLQRLTTKPRRVKLRVVA